MTTKTSVLVQPPFDPRILSIKTPGSSSTASAGTANLQKLGWNSEPANSPIRRGYMVWAKPYPGGASTPCRFNYLYNPSTVMAEYNVAVNNSSLANEYVSNIDQGTLMTPMNNTASWTVMFDRTYELWGSYDTNGNAMYPNNEWGNDPRVVGCWADILQLQWFTGMWYSASGVTNIDPATGGVISNGINQYGPYIPPNPMILQLCWAFFGTAVGSFYGAITEWDYTITHYNQFMVPMRCVIDINMMMFPNPNNSTSKSTTGATQLKPGQVSTTTGAGATGSAYYQPSSGGYVGHG